MARVEWTRQSGDDVETVVGMLLCSQFRNAVRVRPSQGDGGIDIFVPGPAGWGTERAVWQIKRYCHNLTGTEKRAIKRSYSRVVETSKKEGWRITEWHLVMPLDLTTQNIGWLDSYTAAADFPRETHGLLLCDTLAGEHPKVIDYYLRDGKERLQAELNHLTALLSGRANRNENNPLIPADILTDLTSIHKALNACDPFYRYDFAVSDAPPSDMSPSEDDLVAVCAMPQDSVWITIKIFASSLAALEERPITAQFHLAVPEDDDELRQQVQKFIDYGAPLSMPAGTVSGSLNLPAGLGGDLSGASLQVVNAVNVAGDDTELAVAMLAPDSETVIASTIIRRTEITSGQGDGFRTVWVDKSNLFNIEMLGTSSAPQEHTWNIQVAYNLNGRRPADVVDSLKFLAAMHAPNRVGLGLTYGPKNFNIADAPLSAEQDPDARRWSAVAEALARIQDHVTVLLRLPAQMTQDQWFDIVTATKLVSGEPVTGTVSGTATVVHHEPQLEPEMGKLYEFASIKATTFTLGEDEIVVGKEVLFFAGRYLEVGEDESTLQPVSENSVTMRYTGACEVGRVLARHLQGLANMDSPT